MAVSRSVLWLVIVGLVSLGAVSTGGALDRRAVADQLICRGPFLYSALQMSAGADGDFTYRWSLRIQTVTGPVDSGQQLEPGQCGWADRAASGEQADTELVSLLPASEVVLEFALDETGRATVTRVDHPFHDVQAHHGIVVVQAAEAQPAGRTYYELSGDVELR
jgi:hypothetical protein